MTEKKDYFDIGGVALTTYYTYMDSNPNDTNKTTALVDTVICEDGAGVEIYAGYRDYDYDANGRIERIYEKDSSGTLYFNSFAYDSKGQMVRHNDGMARQTYKYICDSAGNISEVWEYPYTLGDLGVGTLKKAYGYSNGTCGDLMTSYLQLGNHAVEYDGMGNMTSFGDTHMTWEGRELIEWRQGTGEDAVTLTFSYDPDGYRASKTVNGTTTDYIVPGGKILAESNGTESIHYFYDPSGSIQGMKYGGTIYYYIKNAEGDILGLVDSSTGDLAATYSYNDWGVPTVTNVGNSTIGDVNPIRYRGYYYDQETGLYYLGSRYYDPEVGRFISADEPEYLGANGKFVSYNLFAYCENDPVNKKDDGGNRTLGLSFGMNGNFVIGLLWSIGLFIDDKHHSDLQYSYVWPTDYDTFSLGFVDLGTGISFQYTNLDTIDDLCGEITYVGTSLGAGPYLGVDAIFAKKRGDMTASLVGYQLTLGSGIGFDVHCNRMKTISIFRNKKEISVVTFGPGHHPVAMTM